MSTRTLLALLISAPALACGGDGDGSNGPPPTPLTVESVRPTDGSTQADPLSPLIVTFGAPLDPASVTPEAFGLSRDGQPVSLSPTYDAASRSVTLAAPLLPGLSYAAAVETTIQGEGGEQLDQRFQWGFSTRAWQSTSLGGITGSNGLAMAADADVHMHLLFWTAAAGGGADLRYATCATQCLVPANWTGATLDHANSGGPVAILADGSALHIAYQDASRALLFYGSCTTGCTVATNWQTVQLEVAADEGHEAIALAADATGRLHLATVVGVGSAYGVAYANCGSACLTAASWQGATVAPSGLGPSLIAEPAGRLHLLYRDPATSTIRYATCATSCETPGGWSDIPADATAITATETALVMDGAGSLHAVYLAGGGVRYAICETGCGMPGAWHSTVIADQGDLRVQVALTLSETGRVHAIFGRSTHLEYATCVSGCAERAGWQVGTGLATADTRHLSLLRDAAGGLHLAFEDITTLTAGYAE